jgi:ankyrin repeat protein
MARIFVFGLGFALSACTPNGATPVQSPPPPAIPDASVEDLIRQLEDLARDEVPRAKLDAFIAAHPSIVTGHRSPYGSALMTALEFAREEMALALLDAGSAAPNEALGLAARGGLDRFVKVLLARGMSPDTTDSWGYTPLHHAAKYGHLSTIKVLLTEGAKPSVRATNDGFTPLHIAVMERRPRAAKALIKAKADLEAKDNDGRTPLHWGGFASSPQPVHLYEDLGKPHDTVFVDPGPAELIDILLDAGSNIEARDNNGDTALYEAANIGSMRGVQKLLARGAKVGVKNKAGRTPRDEAKRRGDTDINKMLMDAR